MKILTPPPDPARAVGGWRVATGDAESGLAGEYVALDRGLALLAGALCLIVAVVYAAVPVVYDTMHLGDTLFISSEAWRIYSGATPVIDFGHFYGGAASQFIAWAYRLFGPTIKSVDYGVLLQLAFVTGLACLFAWRRIGPASFAALVLLLTALLLARAPLESFPGVVRPTSAHSFIYNRFGLALAVLVTLYVGLRCASKPLDLACGLVAGLVLVVTALTKSSFAVIAPAVLLGLLLQARFRELPACLCGIGAGLLILDPGAQRIVGSYHYVLTSVGMQLDSSAWPMTRQAIQLLLAQPAALTAAGVSMVLLLVGWGRAVWRMVGALALVFGAGVGMSATMGGSLGQQTVPLLAAVSIVGFEIARRLQAAVVNINKTLMIVVVGFFALPHMANTLVVSAEALLKRDQVLLTEGPLAGYLHESGTAEPETGEITQYGMLVEGLRALDGIGNASELGIISDAGLNFDFALGAPPVLDFPLWPRITSPEFARDNLSPEVDLVLLSRSAPGGKTVGSVMRDKLGGEFVLCLQTKVWDIFARRSSDIEGCTIPPMADREEGAR